MPVTVTKMRGYEGQLYYTVPSGVETLFANVTDIELDVKADEIDFSDHSTQGWKDKAGGLKEWSGTVKAMAIQGGVDEQAFLNALTGETNLALSFRPQDVTGGVAFTGTCAVVQYKHNMPNSGAQTIDLTLSGRGALVPGTVAVAGS